MALKVIGAGIGRTGTLSLKAALERLLGAPCHHMVEFFKRPEDVRPWAQALEGRAVDWNGVLANYHAAVDWTAAAFFPELFEASPDAIVILSVRDTDEWWRSYRSTVVEELQSERAPVTDPYAAALLPVKEFTIRMLETRFTPRWVDEAAAKQAFEQHNRAVRAAVPPDQLIEWRPADGWPPVCAALGLPTPDEPFPRANTTADFRAGNFFATDAA